MTRYIVTWPPRDYRPNTVQSIRVLSPGCLSIYYAHIIYTLMLFLAALDITIEWLLPAHSYVTGFLYTGAGRLYIRSIPLTVSCASTVLFSRLYREHPICEPLWS